MLRSSLVRCLLCVFVALASSMALAIDSSEAAAKVQQATGGRVLGVERIEKGGQVLFKVKVMTASGEVRFVLVDAKTGATR